MENNQNLKYIVYITTNTINGKIYIGVHGTETPYKFDNYLGCGSVIGQPSTYSKGKFPLHAAILKYGTHAFKRATIKVFDTLQDALDLEAWLVTKEFISRPDTYNATLGGGMPPLLTKKVNQFDLNGQFVKTWNSETEIIKYFGCKVQMSEVISKKRNFAGYFWSFNPSINVDEYKKVSIRGFIDQYNLDGVYLNSFKSTNEASQKLDIDFKKLNRSIFTRKACEGYYFLNSGVDIYEVLKSNMSRKVGKCPIYMYNLKGIFELSFESINKAVKYLGHASDVAIKKAITNGTSYREHLWSCYKSEKIDFTKKGITKRRNILQYDKNGNFVKEWDDYKACKQEFKYCLACCNGKCKSTQGYIFKYAD